MMCDERWEVQWNLNREQKRTRAYAMWEEFAQ